MVIKYEVEKKTTTYAFELATVFWQTFYLHAETLLMNRSTYTSTWSLPPSLCRSWWQNLTTQTSINSITTLGQTTSTSPCPMSYSREADFYNPYARIQLENTSNAAILERDLASVINSFAAQNAHLAVKSPSPSGAMVTQFVSNCNSTSGRYYGYKNLIQ